MVHPIFEYKVINYMEDNINDYDFRWHCHGRHSANREIGRLIYIEYPAISAVGLLIGLVIRLLRVKLTI